MITSPRRCLLSPRVTRHFEFSRLQDQFIATAYHTLIPVVSRPLERRRSRCPEREQATATSQRLRTKARGA
jgi:hypothetical protein